MLTGRTAEVAPWLASHMDVNAIDLAGAAEGGRSPTLRGGGRRQPQAGAAAGPREPTGPRTPGLERLLRYLETKTVWHPIGV